MTRTVLYGSQEISYVFGFAPRKTLAIAVHPDGSVEIKAPVDTAEELIDQKVRKRAAWILRQQRFFSQFLPRSQPRRYLSGEAHLYLGKKYRLKIALGEKSSIKLSGGYFQIQSPDVLPPARIGEILKNWYIKHAQDTFTQVLNDCVSRMKIVPESIPVLTVKSLNLRWGSLSVQKRLLLNLSLIQAPLECIEYVILHELCHLENFNHGPEFYRRLETVLPDWKARKLKLEKVLA